MSDDILSITARADFGQVGTEAKEAAAAVSSSAAQITSAMDGAAAAHGKLASSSMEAQHALRGMGEEIGVKMPRFVSSFVSHLDGVGPALAAAFSTVAVIGLVQILAQIPDVIDRIVGKFTGWDDAARKTYNDLVNDNNRLLMKSVELADKTEALNLIGITGSQKYAREIANIVDSEERWGRLGVILQQKTEALNKELEKTKNDALANIPGAQFLHNWASGAAKDAKDLKEQLEAVKKAQEEVAARGQGKAQEIPGLGKEAAVAAAKEKEQADKEAAALQMHNLLATNAQIAAAYKEQIEQIHKVLEADALANKSMTTEGEKAAKATQTAWDKAWEAVVIDQEKANREQEILFKKLEKPWDDLAKSLQRTMTHTAMGLIEGTLSIKQAFTKLGEGILETTINSLAKVVAQHAATAIMTNVIEKSQMAASIAAFLGYQSTKLAASKTAEVAQGATDAGLAGAAAFASVIEALPFPVNMAVAPGVAAEAMTATMALASFAAGTDYVPRTGLALLHEGEAITPASQNRGGMGSGIHVHFNVSAVDAPGVQAFFDQHGDKMARTLSRQVRRRGQL